ncbi:MAG TPA: 4'-phosphopantetheinyl transferase superfamily protein [Streptosporangiaceae bacterium]
MIEAGFSTGAAAEGPGQFSAAAEGPGQSSAAAEGPGQLSTAHVWWARRQDASLRLAALLDDTERQRWTAYRREEDRQRFLVGCTLTKTALASYQPGRHPADVRLDRTCAQCGKPHGKPRVADGDPELGGLELSVSHSGDRIAVAVARATPVGVDVEDASPSARRRAPAGDDQRGPAGDDQRGPAGHDQRGLGGDDQRGLERYVLSEAELAAIDREQPDPDTRRRYFLVTWTRKEAVTKATGDGLRVSFRQVVLSSPAAPPDVLAWPYPQPPDSVSLFDLHADEGYVAALAVIGRCDSVVSRSGTALLEDVKL